MNNKNNLAPHEMLELRELMDADIVGLKKLKANMKMIEDDELKSFMEHCLDNKKENINSIQNFIESNFNI